MPVGRPKKFDEEEILEQAMCLFWEEGYHQVSIRDIEKATKTKSQSLYNHFGDKERLFIGAVEHYIASRLTGLITLAGQQSEPQAAITLILEHFRGSAKKKTLSGCFLANAIIDMGSNKTVKSLFDQGFGLLTETLAERLKEIPGFSKELAETRAATITNSIIGLAVSSRSQPSSAHVDQVFSGIMELTRP